MLFWAQRISARQGGGAYGEPVRLSPQEVILIVSGRFVADQTGGPVRVAGGIGAAVDGAGKPEPHQGAELEAVAGAGRHYPALRTRLLDDEALVFSHSVEADLQPLDFPVLE